jgi:hypothetical protein
MALRPGRIVGAQNAGTPYKKTTHAKQRQKGIAKVMAYVPNLWPTGTVIVQFASKATERKGNEIQAREPRITDFKLLLWNTEGLNGACNLILENIFKREQDIMIITETFLTEWHYIYGVHTIISLQHEDK